MCDDNCENLKPDRIRCEACKTINLARIKERKPDMQMYEKTCTPAQICMPVQEMLIKPTCIRICNKDDFRMTPRPTCIPRTHQGPGVFIQMIKTGLLVGAVYFTYSQGVWGDQEQVTECLNRWTAYVRSLGSRRPPEFDKCGNVIVKESSESLFAPAYDMYKNLITTCFAGVVKFPTVIKCIYMDYQKALEKKEADEKKERAIRKKSI